MAEEPQDPHEFLRPLAQAWRDKLAIAKRHKEPFTKVAEQCTAFFSASTGFMWKDSFRSKFIKGDLKPKFQMTLAKGFELVALFGPTLYWKNPQRTVKPRKRFVLDPAMLGDPNDPQVQQQFQFIAQQEAAEDNRTRARNALLETVLNYLPTEQPGGLALHSELAITEALVKGRGLLLTKPYKMPGSRRILVHSEWVSVDDLLIDPDCTDPTLTQAKWIALRTIEPVYEAERRFGLQPGSLKRYATYESGESQALKTSDKDREDRRHGQTFDLIEYWQVWSKGGVGHRLSGDREVAEGIAQRFDEWVGDYAYLCIAEGVPWPLNAPTSRLNKADREQTAQMFRWPVECWRDDRWPVSYLDFYCNPNSAWPLAPMAMGLGELIFLNVMISHLANHIWQSSRTLLAVAKQFEEETRAIIEKGEDLSVVPISVQDDIKKLIQFIQHPPVNYDAWKIIEHVMELFDKRTGLSELLYGMNPGGTQQRSAAEVRVKNEHTQVRPDYMAGKVEAWQSVVADKEKYALHEWCTGQDFLPILGQYGSMLWDQLIAGADTELVSREMVAHVEAGSARRPNRERDADNLNQMLPIMFPELSKHADATGDTNPLNAFIGKIGETIELDMTGLQMGPRVPMPPPPPPPEVQQQMERDQQFTGQMQQMDLQIKQADLQIKQVEAQTAGQDAGIEAQKVQAEIQAKQAELQMDQQKFQMESAQDQQNFQREYRQDERKFEQEMQQEQQKFQLEAQLEGMKARQQMAVQQQQAEMQRAQGEQQMVQQAQAQQFEQQAAKQRMATEQQAAKQKMQTDQQAAKAKIQQQKQAAAVKPQQPKAPGGSKT